MTTRATLADDPLGPWLDSLEPSLAVFCRAAGRPPWGFRIEARPDATFHVLTQGEALLEVDGVDGTFELGAGDLVLLTGGAGHQLRDDPGSTIRPLEDAVARGTAVGKSYVLGGAARSPDGEAPSGPAGASVMVCGGCRLGPGGADRRGELLPPVLVHRCGPPLVELLDRESRSLASGAEAVLKRLLSLLVTQALRAHLDGKGPAERARTMDTSMSRVLAYIHGSLDTSVDMEGLCAVAHLSPTTLTERFHDALGTSPVRYARLTRLNRAAELLANGDTSLERIARRVGYRSASTFSRAFRREFDVSPGAYRAARK